MQYGREKLSESANMYDKISRMKFEFRNFQDFGDVKSEITNWIALRLLQVHFFAILIAKIDKPF